jgi:DNA helicase-2/ATP-dependent DNA helicase PcrA
VPRVPVEENTPAAALLAEEEAMLGRVRECLEGRARGGPDEARSAADFDKDLIALRDQIAEEKQEDLPSLVEQMARVQAIAGGRRARAQLPVDIDSPYFAHMRLRSTTKGAERVQEVLIGKYGLIDRAAGVQIVDWRDAPVSQVYYRYEEGDDYDEEIEAPPTPGSRGAPTQLRGVVEARRNVTIARGRLRRVGCPQGTFVASADGRWFSLEGQGVALLGGGSGTSARVPAGATRGPRFSVAAPARSEHKQLPEIAALIDREQFDLITRPSSGVVVIQGGAGSGKTTVALHRIAYLVFDGRNAKHGAKPSHCLFVVPSEALSRYVSGVLPALGVNGVPVTTFRSWARNLRKRLVPSAPDRYTDETPPSVSRCKKHPMLLSLLDEAVATEVAAVRTTLNERLGEAAAPLIEAWDARAARPPLARVRGLRSLVEKRGLPIQPAVAAAADQVLRQATNRLRDVRRIVFELYTDRARLERLSAAAVDPPSARDLDELVAWSSAQLDEELPPELEGIDEDRLQPVDGRPLEPGGADTTPHSAAVARIDVEDDALLLRCFQLVHGHFERVDGEPLIYDHIAVDEAQDLSASEIRVLYEALSERRSFTIAGDTAQRVIFDNAFHGWSGLLADLGLSADAATAVRPLRIAYRSTRQVMKLARAVLGPLGEGIDEAPAREGAPVELHELPGMGEAVAFTADALRSLLAREPSASVAVISRHPGQADAWYNALDRAEVPSLRRVRRQEFPFVPGVDVTDVGQVKGLEFDYVILVDVNDTSYPSTIEARHLLHIGATRATHQLWLIATGPVSELVKAWHTDEESSQAAG